MSQHDRALASAEPQSARERAAPRPRRLFVSCLLTWLLPYAFFSLFLTFADLQAPYDSIPIFHPFVVAYVFGSAVLAALWITRRYSALVDRDRAGASFEETRHALRDVLLTVPALVLVYLAVGSVATMALDAASGLATLLPFDGLGRWGGLDLLVAGLGSLIILAFILLPLGLVCLDEFGIAFGHALEDEPVVPIWLRSSHGLVMVVMIGTAMVLQEYIRLGRLESAPLVLVLTTIPYAIVVMLLNIRYTSNALHSVEAYLAAARSDVGARGAGMMSDSLDEVGVVVRRVGELVHKLEASEARLRDFADAASDYYFESDARFRITWLSSRSEEITGRAQSEVLGRSFQQLSDDLAVDVPPDQLERLIRKQSFRDLHVSITGADGVARRLRLSGVPILDAEGGFAGYRGVGTDVTEMADAQAQLRDREAQLAQAQKMEAVGQLTGGVAHDFNNLLLVVGGSIELAREEADPVERKALLDAATEAAQRGAGLVQHLLAFSRRQVLRPEVLDLPERLEGITSLLRSSLGERIDLRLELGAELRPLLIDAVQLESALLNLAINARDAMPEGGQLTLRASNRRLVGNEHGLSPGDYVELSVEDDGLGMPASTVERVFEPFFSTKPFGAGSGLGLSMVYGFVSQSRGAVDIRSSEGVGTTIRLLLPASVEEPAPAEDATAAVERARRGERILLVEDETEVRRALTASLEGAGYVVASVADADAGRRLFDTGLPVDLLLSDVVLPGSRSGVDLAAELRRVAPSLPCLLMSGYTAEHLSELPPELADLRVLAKPFRMKALLAEVDALLEAREPRGSAARPRLVSKR